MKPFYRMLTCAALIFQSCIILHLLCLLHQDPQKACVACSGQEPVIPPVDKGFYRMARVQVNHIPAKTFALDSCWHNK